MLPFDPSHWKFVFGFFAFGAALSASLHAILRRRNPHAVLWWIGLSWTVPVAGPLLYYFFGINRIERMALRRRKKQRPPKVESPSLILSDAIDENSISPEMRHLIRLCRVVENTVKQPLTKGNRIQPLFNGEEAFPRMLEAIAAAKKSVGVSTYIFEWDPVGEKFIKAFSAAAERGVQVRVLIDDVGSGWAWRSVYKELCRRKVPVAYFMPTLAPWRLAYFNLRSHRKILTIDGAMAFSGGMNITNSHMISGGGRGLAEDVHFQIEGPVVAQVQDVFRLDWHFSTGELLQGESWFPTLPECGVDFARGISDGPDEEFERCKLTLLGALANAKRTVRIMTPYLIPDQSLISALCLAAMGGVKVDIVLPSQNDMTLVSWATQAYLWQVLERGVRIWRTPPPFNHAKLMVVDGGWTLFGSSNWDPRSLRLNFEFNMESYSRPLAERLESFVDEKIAGARPITLNEVDSRPVPIKIRDGVARLFSPML